MALESIRYNDGKLDILDQLLLPAQNKYVSVKGVEDGWKVINRMQVRGMYVKLICMYRLINLKHVLIIHVQAHQLSQLSDVYRWRLKFTTNNSTIKNRCDKRSKESSTIWCQPDQPLSTYVSICVYTFYLLVSFFSCGTFIFFTVFDIYR